MDSFNFLSNRLFDGSTFLNFLIRFIFDLIVIYVLARLIYYRVRRKRNYLFSLVLLNIIIFFVCYLLNSVQLTIGFAFGIFALFSILRYRTSTVPIKEMTYMFIAISVAIINALSNENSNFAVIIFTNIAILAFTFILEKAWVKNESRKTIIYENIAMIKPENHALLLKDLKERTGLSIHRFEIGRIDFLRDIARIRAYYYDVEQTEVKSMKYRMIKRIFFFSLIFFFLFNGLYSKDRDKELWTGFELSFPIVKDFSLEFGEELRLHNNMSSIKKTISDFSLCYRFFDDFKFSTTYRLNLSSQKPEHELMLNFYARYKLKPIKLTYRLRYDKEFDYDSKYNKDYFRNKLMLEYNLKKSLSPFIGGEIFYRAFYAKGDRLNEWRIYLGFNVEIFKDREISLFYMLDDEINVKKPDRSSVVGIFYNFDF